MNTINSHTFNSLCRTERNHQLPSTIHKHTPKPSPSHDNPMNEWYRVQYINAAYCTFSLCVLFDCCFLQLLQISLVTFFRPLRVSLISSGIQPCKRRARRPGYSWRWCCSWTCRHPAGCPVPLPSCLTPHDPCHHDRDLRDPAGTSGPLCYPFLLCHLSCKSHMINHWMTICTSSMESIKIVNMNKSITYNF